MRSAPFASSVVVAALAVAVAVAVVGGACNRANAPAASSAPSPPTAPGDAPTAPGDAAFAQHREPVRRILEIHCGLCHLPGDDEGRAIGLPIYDLRRVDWSSTLSDAQLPIVEQKLVDDGADDDERKIAHQFVLDELLWRDAHPDDYSLELRLRPPRGGT